ncbi:MAG: hypothetical protein HQL07_10355 [Nitrospirae bacterium]|nr:hypothetical protein [Magnetococcales bacterium]
MITIDWCVVASINTAIISWLVTSRVKSADELKKCITTIKEDAEELAIHGSRYWTPAPTKEERIETVVEIRIKYDSLSDKIDGLKKYTKKNIPEIRTAANVLYDAITGGSYQSATFKPNKANIENIKICRKKLDHELNRI